MKKQKQFTREDKTSNENYLNVLDKGYSSTLHAQLHGQQYFQADFAAKLSLTYRPLESGTKVANIPSSLSRDSLSREHGII